MKQTPEARAHAYLVKHDCPPGHRAIAAVMEAMAEERERCAAMLEQTIADGYEVPLVKQEQCDHGKFGWEDCVACYDTELARTAAAIRAPR